MKVSLGNTSTVAYGKSDPNTRNKRELLLANQKHAKKVEVFEKTTHLTFITTKGDLTYIIKN